MSDSPSLTKVLSREELAGVVRAAKARGQQVVFTNGTFDIVHVGHIRSLQGARAEGDLLVVGINSDASVQSYKGPHLPVQPADERAEVIAALACVDYVTIFPEPTVDALLALLEPQIMAKGTEYDPATIPERATVESYGGRIAIVGDSKAHSTRWLIQRIRALPE